MQEDINKQHAELALAIKAAKKKMFRQHREGESLVKCANQFMAEIEIGLHEVIGAEDPMPRILAEIASAETPTADEPEMEPFEQFKQRHREIEAIAARAVFNEDRSTEEHQLALIELLDRLSDSNDAADLALSARNAAFKRCTPLIDESVVLLLAKGASQ